MQVFMNGLDCLGETFIHAKRLYKLLCKLL